MKIVISYIYFQNLALQITKVPVLFSINSTKGLITVIKLPVILTKVTLPVNYRKFTGYLPVNNQ